MIENHEHNGIDARLVDVTNLSGFIDTIDTVPTETPRNFYEQFKIYKNATTYRFYWYDFTNNEWRFSVGT